MFVFVAAVMVPSVVASFPWDYHLYLPVLFVVHMIASSVIDAWFGKVWPYEGLRFMDDDEVSARRHAYLAGITRPN